MPSAVALAVLSDLCRSGMLGCDEEASIYFYEARPEPMCDIICSVADLYGSHLVEITMLIHSKLDRKAQHRDYGHGNDKDEGPEAKHNFDFTQQVK